MVEAVVFDKTSLVKPDSKFHTAKRELVKNDAIIVSWSDISLIQDFFYVHTQEVEEENRLKVSKGLHTFLADEFKEHAPDLLYCRKLQ